VIVLDTHALVWWVNGDSALSRVAGQAIEKERKRQGEIIISSISAWEIAMLLQKERLVLSMDVETWLRTVTEVPGVRFIPVDNGVAVESTRLPGRFHKDPADRLIVALARTLSAPLVTSDRRIRGYRHVKTIW